MIEKIQNNDLHRALESAYAVVDFSAVWCGPCQMLAPVLEEVAAQMQDVAFFQVDTDENMELAVQYGIQSIPTLLLLKNGRPVDRALGFMPKSKLVSFIDRGRSK